MINENQNTSTPHHARYNTKNMINSNVLSLSVFLYVLRRYKYRIISFTLLMTLFSAMISLSITPIYQATTTLLIQQGDNKVLSIEDMYGIDKEAPEYYNTQYEVLKSRSIAEKVVNQLGLVYNPLFNTSLQDNDWKRQIQPYIDIVQEHVHFMAKEATHPQDRADEIFNAVVDKFSENIRIELVKQTKVVKIHFTSADKKLAAMAADAIADAYITNFMESKIERTTVAHSWMQEKMQSLGNELKMAEQALQDYREKENLIDIGGIMTLSNSELQSLTLNYVDAKQKSSQTRAILSQIKKMDDSDNSEAFFNLPEVLSHSLVQNLKQQQSIAQSKVEELQKRYGNKHPSMIAAISERDAYDSSIRRQVHRIVAGVQQQYQADKARESLLANQLNRAKKSAQKISRKQFHLVELERQFTTKNELYNTFFKRIQETTAAQGIQEVNALIVDKAYVPKDPIKPRKQLIILLTMILSFLLICCQATISDINNNTIRSIADVEEKLNLPIIGVLPDISDDADYIIDNSDHNADKKNIDILKIFSYDRNQAYPEAVRTARTNLTLSSLDKPRKTYMVTSTIPGEGKSSTSLALAVTLSQMGKTIIIGADLRKPGLIKKFDFKHGTLGLANILTGATQLEDAIQSYGELDIIVAGIIPPNPQELLLSGFGQVLEQLKQQYDYIIVDCPPIQSVADGIGLSRLCDGLIYIVESGKVPTPTIQHAIGRLLQVGAPVLGVIINKVNNKSGTYGAYDAYSYGYYQYDCDSSNQHG
ncbi:MAG: polysaccharide biosynthesis tyrosine autokinase [Pseudomonadales bacterium]|nr:polysaccharide biosynthesis tyrosine autokinase [Pseudomonadales bacterium]